MKNTDTRLELVNEIRRLLRLVIKTDNAKNPAEATNILARALRISTKAAQKAIFDEMLRSLGLSRA